MTETIIYLIRHAKSEGNLARIWGGDSDISDEGREKTIELLEKLEGVKPFSVYASDKKRTKQTAEILAKKWNLPVKINKKISEKFYGELEEKEILQEHKDFYEKLLLENPDSVWDCHLTENDETNRQVVERFLLGLNEIISENIGKTFLVVSHGNVIRSFLVHIGFGDFSELRGGTFKNSGYVKLKYSDKKFSVLEMFGVEKFIG